MLIPPSIAPVFIGYRHADTRHAAARLRDSLAELGHRVWFDLDDVPSAVPYRSRITSALRECEVALIVIGAQWLTVTDRHGGRRLDDPEDDVRLEVELALGRPDVTLVPVLVDDAKMPSRGELPTELQGLCELSAARLTHDLWPYGVRALHHTIDGAARRGRMAWAEALVVAAIAVIPAAVVAAAEGLRTSTSELSAGSNLARLAVQRAELWAVVMAAVLAWVAWRRPGRRWTSSLRAGLFWGAVFGLVGAVVHGIPTYLIDGETWVGWGLSDGTVKSVRIAAYALGVGVTGAGIGALVGAAWNPPGIARGLLAGLVAGALLGWVVRTGIGIGANTTQTKVFTSILVAVGIVGAAIACQWVTRATAAREAHA